MNIAGGRRYILGTNGRYFETQDLEGEESASYQREKCSVSASTVLEVLEDGISRERCSQYRDYPLDRDCHATSPNFSSAFDLNFLT